MKLPSKYLHSLLAFLLVALTALVYWPGLSGSFIFDDYPNIVTNSRVHAEVVDLPSLRTAARAYEPGAYGRPLAMMSFAVDHAIGGKDPWIYKFTSLLIHLVNTLLVFWLVKRLMVSPRAGPGWSTTAAATIALIWAAHPLQVSSVLYVVQRMEVLSLTFVLLALLCYLHGRQLQIDGRRGWPWLAGSAFLAGIGMLSKETAALFPAFALSLELTILQFDARSLRTSRLLKTTYLAGAIAGAAVFVFWVLPPYMAPHAFDGRDFTLYERLLTQLRVLPMYLGQMLVPLPSSLTFYYDAYAKSTGWLHPISTLWGGFFLLALLSTAWWLRKRMPLTALGIFWFFAAHLLTSNVFNLELVFEHRNYFALLGVLLALADLVRRIPMRDGPALKYVGVGAIALCFGGLAMIRSATWGNELLLATDLVSINPTSQRASSDLATLYVGMSDSNPDSPFYSLGQQEFERGSLMPNSSPLPEHGLILMAATTGQPVKAEWWDRMEQKVRSRPIGPQEVIAVRALMEQRYEGVELDDTRLSRLYSALLARGPMPPQMYAQYGDFALKYLKDEALADHMFVTAIERNPDDAPYAQKIISILAMEGHSRQANAVWERASSLGLLKNRPGEH